LAAYDYEPFTVFSIGSFSKIFSPGFRTAWVHCKGKLREQLVESPLLESGGGFCSVQTSILKNMIKDGLFDSHLEKSVHFYEEKGKFMYNELRKHFSDDQILKFRIPSGGYFIWVEMLGINNIQSEIIFNQFVIQKIVVLKGSRGFLESEKDILSRQYFRLSFSCLNHDDIIEGVSRIANIINKYRPY